jgi:tight adherence protein C
MPLVLAALLLIAGILIVVGLWLPQFVRDPVDAYVTRLAERRHTLEEVELAESFAERVLRPMVQGLARLVGRLNPGARQDRRQRSVQDQLNLAGNPHGWTPNDFLGVRVLCGLLAAVGALLLFLSTGAAPFALPAAIAVGAASSFAPELYLRQIIADRQHAIQRGLPDVIDLLCICVQAGLGFDAALIRLCEKSDNALAQEFARMLREIQLGRPRRDALRDLATRNAVPDLANFISAVIQAEQLGVGVTQVLLAQSEQTRDLRRLRAEEVAAQAPIKMLIPMLLFIFPALCVVLLGPIWPLMTAAGVRR